METLFWDILSTFRNITSGYVYVCRTLESVLDTLYSVQIQGFMGGFCVLDIRN